MNNRITILFLFAALILLTGLLTLVVPAPGAANADGLPPRETPTSGGGGGQGGGIGGAFIELVTPGTVAGSWAIVQWSDANGDWHDVEGWRGWAGDSCRWWVHAKDFGRGPFRWVVTQEPGGPVVQSSAEFFLPVYAGQTVLIPAQ